VAPTLTSSDATFAISASTCTDILAQAATCTFKVAFTPTAAATKTATLTATAGTVTTTASATGVGALAPAITLTPSAVAFGTLLPGQTYQRLVTVKNVGGFPLSGLSIFLGGTATAPYTLGSGCGPADLLPGASCDFFINANPTDPGTANSAANSTVLVTAGGANPASVMGTVSGTVSWPLQPNVTSYHFGSVKVGAASSVVIRFTNISHQPAQLHDGDVRLHDHRELVRRRLRARGGVLLRHHRPLQRPGDGQRDVHRLPAGHAHPRPGAAGRERHAPGRQRSVVTSSVAILSDRN
jgi:hypothetical protein